MSNKYDNYDLFEETDRHLTRPKIQTTRESRFYPSEASVQFNDKHGELVTEGTCMRAAYYRLSGEFSGTPYDARTEFIFAQGNFVEDMLIAYWKEMGVWVANNVKFVDKDHNISGEVDAFLVEPDGTLYGVEVKSFYGYFAEKNIMGNKSTVGQPKMSQLLQTLIYLYHFRESVPYFRMAYFARDSVKRRTFKIELHEEDGLHYPVIEGVIQRAFTMESIYARYAALQGHLDTHTVPPKDYREAYTAEEVERFKSQDKIAKTKYEKWQRNPTKYPIGDWQCQYCKFSEECRKS